jgi:hypothetical protein
LYHINPTLGEVHLTFNSRNLLVPLHNTPLVVNSARLVAERLALIRLA